MKTNPTLRRWCAARFFALLLFPVCALAFHPPEGARLDDFDGRGAAAPAAKNAAAEAALATAAPGVRVDRDRVTGGAAFVAADGIMLTKPLRARGAAAAAPVDHAKVVQGFLNTHRGIFRHGAEALTGARTLRDYTTDANGVRTMVWQQQLDGVRIFESTLHAHVTAAGELVNVSSRMLANAAAASQLTAPQRAARLAAPAVTARRAVALAGKNLREEMAEADVVEDGAAEGAEQRQKFRAAALPDATAELRWLPMDDSHLRLCWEVVTAVQSRGEMFRVLIDAQTGEAVVRQGLTNYFTDASYRVYTSDSPSPMSPGLATPLSTQPPIVARTLVTTPALNATASPNGWIDDGVNETRGNNVDAHLDLNADNVADLPRPQGSPNRVFDFALDLTQPPTTAANRDAAVTQLFYLCNWMHDKLYALGFTEASGNFQNNNFGRGGTGNDAVQADAQDGSGTNNANFSTPADGSPGRMQMYVFTGPTPARDGDFDAEIVLHEYTHGLSNRLVGGGVGISALQTQGMGEGWSDFYSLALLSEAGDNVNGNYATGGYATYLLSPTFTQNYYYGIRRYPYSTDLTKNPLTFKDIDPAQISPHTGIPASPVVGGGGAGEVHNQGEVWCVTLWEARANLINKFGYATGNQLILQLVTDGMKLAPANPTFLQARDAIIQADAVLNAGANRLELWTAFAKRGMGSGASSPANSTTSGVVESFDLPDDLGVSPGGAFAASGALGGPFTPSAKTYTLSNSSAVALNWTAVKTQPWLTVAPASGALAPGATVTVTATLNAAATSLAAGLASDTITFRNLNNGVTQTRAVSVDVTPPRFLYYALDTDPGWPRTGQWAFGHPTGGGGLSYGFPDPTNGATGANVFGVNLAGDYAVTVGGPYYVTLGPINLTNIASTRLQFQRWLNSDYQTWAYATIEVSTNGTTWTTIFSNGTSAYTANAWTKVQYDISALVDGKPAVYIRWGYQVGQSSVFPYSGWNIDDIEILGAPPTNLTLALPATAVEGAAPLTGTVTVAPAPETNLTVNLSSNDPTEATVPASVVIPAGQTSATFAVTIVDDALLDGSQSLVITASAAGYPVRTAPLTVLDNETAALTLTLPPLVTEGDTGWTGTVTMSGVAGKAVTVALTSGTPAELTVPATAVIPAGQSSVVFPLTVIDDNRIDGPQSVTVTAQVVGWTDGSASLVVADNETKTLSVTLPAMREGDTGKTGTVSIPGTLPAPLVVALVSSDLTAATVPVSATIPAGLTSVTFPITVVDDTLVDGAQPVTITASAAGFTSGAATGSVADNEAHHFSVAVPPGPYLRGAPIVVTVTALDVNGAVITNFTGPVPLSALGEEGAMALTPAVTGAFVNGVWTGNVAVGAYGSGVTILAATVGGQTGQSAPFEVILGPLHHFAWSTVGSPQGVDAPFAATLTALDAAGNVVVSYNSPVTLTARVANASLPVRPVGPLAFANGVWSGNVSVPLAASGAVLRAATGALTLDSNVFDVTVPTLPSTAGTVFAEDFESGVFSSAWTITGTGNFRTQITTYQPHAGTKHMAMDQALDSGSYARNEATLTLNLAGRTGVVLKFWAVQFNDEPDGPPPSPFPSTGADFDGVAISADGGANWYEVQPLRTLLTTYTQLTVDLDAALAAHGLAYSSAFKIRFNQYDNYSLGTDGIGIDDILITANQPPSTLTLTLPAQAAEGAGTLQGSVSVTTAPQTDLVLNLSSKSAAKVTVPPTVTIPAGQKSATFPLTVLDDPFVDGTKNVVITAVGPGFLETGAILQVIDNDSGVLTLALPATVTEGVGTVTGTLSLSVPSLVPFTVALTSNDTSEITVPAGVTLAAGQTSITFDATVVEDGLVDGTQTVTLTAHASAWIDGTATVSVLDSGRDATTDWPTFGNGPGHTGYQPIALGTRTYQASWTTTFPTSTRGLNQVAVSNGTVFVTPYVYYDDTYLSALNASTGAELWRKSFVSSLSVNPPTVDSGKVYVQKGMSTTPGNDAQLWCLAASSGTTVWTAPFGAQGERYFAPTVVNDGVWVDGGTYGGLYGFNVSNGTQRFFNSTLAQYDQWTPTYYGGTIYTWVGGVFRAHDPLTGTVLWSSTISVGNPYSMNTVAVIEAGKAYVIGVPNLYAIDLTTHATAWTVSGTFTGSPAVANGQVFALLGGDVKAYNSQTGALVGTYSTGNSTISGQPIVTTDTLIVTSSANTYIFDLQTFALKQTLASGGAASLANGVLYLPGADGLLRTFRPSGQNTIALTLPVSSVTEGAPDLTGTVSLASAATGDTVIVLSANGSNRVTLPASVTIPSGQASATFQLTIVNDSLLNGSETVPITARGSSYLFFNGFAALTVLDNETATITLSLPASATEGSADVTGTLTVSAAPAANITVNLTSSDVTEATVPATVTVLAGQTTATFPLTIVDDTLIDGTQPATITASVPGWVAGTATIQILDNETRTLTLSAPSSVYEGATATGTVSIPGTLPAALTVTLTSANPAQLTVPATVTIPAGSTSVSFVATGVDDTLFDGAQTVAISAAAATFTGASGSTVVYDNDVHHFTFGTIAAAQIANQPFTASVSARDVNNLSITTYNGAANLTASGTGGALVVAPAVVTFSSGSWNGNLTIAAPSTGVTVTATAGTVTGVSNSFTVGVGAADHLSWSAIASPKTAGIAFNATVVAKDAYGNTVPTVNGAATLSAGPPSTVTGIGTSNFANLNESSAQERHQVIYQRAEVGSAGQISSLAMQVYVYTGGTLTNATVRMKHTTLADFASSAAWQSTGWTTVFQGSLTLSSSAPAVWVTIPLTAPFQYDGTSNLMVDISHNGGTAHVHSIATTKPAKRTVYYYGSGFADPLTWTGTTNPAPSASAAAMNLRLGFAGTVPVLPASVTLANGTWTGPVAVQQAATGIVLKARTAAGLAGESNAFTVAIPPAPTLAVSPADGLAAAGLRGGPFTPAGKVFTLSNPGIGTVAWTAAKTAAWVDLSATSGTLAAGASTTVTASLNAAANALASGGFTDTLTFTNTTNGVGSTTRPLALTVTAVGDLAVTPATALTASGPFGGPFTPASQTYTLANPGDAALSWTAGKTAAWLTLSAASGTLAPGASTTVTATINAPTVLPGSYSDTVTFTNTSTGRGTTTRAATLAVTLPAPVLAPEPVVTGGLSNTVAWSAVGGASAYEVQAATDAAFTSPVSSGWLAGTSFTFTGLGDGTLYYYRVRARVVVSEQAGAWSQTTQAEFDTGTKSNVVTGAPGQVTLASGTGAPITGLPANASFESGVTGTGGAITNWTIDNTSQMGTQLTSTVTTPFPTNGLLWLNTFTYYQTAHVAGDYVRVTQSVDFTGANTMIFDALLRSSGTWSGTIIAEARIDGVAVWSRTAQGTYLDQAVNVSGYTGVHTLEFRNTVTTAGTYDSQWAMWDNVRMLSANGYVASGTLTAPAVVPAPWQRWNALTFAKDTSAAGTALTVDVLSPAGTLLAANVAAGTDLNTIAAIAGQPSIRLRANLSTTNSASSPRLDDWTVAWQAVAPSTTESVWSDPVSSTQDASAPLLTVTSAPATALAFYVLTGTAADASGLAGLTVNGVPAESADGFAHWRTPPLHLAPGANTFTIVAADNAAPANAATVPVDVTFTALPGDLDGDGLPDAWELAHGLDPADDGWHSPGQGAAGDLDGDGLPNLMEFALGLDPAVPDPGALPSSGIEKNPADNRDYLVFSFRRPVGSSPFSFTPEVCGGLGGAWSSAAALFQEISATPEGNGLTETAKIRVLPALDAPGGAPRFIRLRVSLP